jgi:glycosyltransferase involved in cell wall biosynthesis
MKILFVALAGSEHTTRWISQVEDQKWQLYLFPSFDTLLVNKNLKSVRYCIPFWRLYIILDKFKLGDIYRIIYRVFIKFKLFIDNKYYEKRLFNYINKIRPNIIHSMETQGAGYLVCDVKINYFDRISKFPIWWHTNWGSDFYIYGRILSHKERIKNLLSNCDYYSCECKRDVDLASNLGFTNLVLPVYPNSGGIKFDIVDKLLSSALPTSKRKLIMLKGYQGWAGRSLVGIRALERCAEILTGYTIIIYSNPFGEDVYISSQLFTDTTGIPIIILPENVPHQEILKYHSNARISIGLSIGDAISTSLLEAMVMGSFPIQSSSSCTTEWFKDGVTGLVVPPEDPDVIELAIRKALLNDALVNEAASLNYYKIKDNAEYNYLKNITIESYTTILSNNHDDL